MPLYKEVSTRYQVQGRRKFYEGDEVRTVSLSEREAKILNESADALGFRYQMIELKKKEKESKNQ